MIKEKETTLIYAFSYLFQFMKAKRGESTWFYRHLVKRSKR